MGVWIETTMSGKAAAAAAVTPCMGVWIETTMSGKAAAAAVTPCMGVWIETTNIKQEVKATQSHPVWVCGLKLSREILLYLYCSHTLYGCVD